MKTIGKKIVNYILLWILLCIVFGGITAFFEGAIKGIEFKVDEGVARMLTPVSLIYGSIEASLCIVLYQVFHIGGVGKRTKNVLKDSERNMKSSRVEGSLENARFMTDKERKEFFSETNYSSLPKLKEDGIPVKAVYSAKGRELDINLMKPAHGIIIGATGSGKTTTFINPVIQILGHANEAGSSMICTDPKGELFMLHSKMLTYLHTGDEIYERTDTIENAGSLELLDPEEAYGDTWYEYEGRAYADCKKLLQEIRSARQKIFDSIYEDLNDLVSVICPIESQNDPVWEKGARSIILAVILAMLEDSAVDELEMTKEKFCFYNVNQAIGNSEGEFIALKEYFQGREKTSKAYGLSRQVLSAPDQTLSSYMSIAFDKLSMFHDEGICAMTSGTDIKPELIAKEKTALFLKIPDEKDTRHVLAAVFILSIYKALIKVASANEDLSLERNVYFLLDEFGNMPKIEKFDKMITVGRSRKIWFQMVVQSFAQLDNVYGQTVSNIIKGNCGLKMFIGSNDLATCEEFSKLCGNMTVETRSVSSSTIDKTGALTVSSSLQQRPLIYPSELMKLNNAKNSGNAIIVTFGNPPLKTMFTPSYKCPLFEIGQMDMEEVMENDFYGAQIYYDLEERNYLVLEDDEEENQL